MPIASKIEPRDMRNFLEKTCRKLREENNVLSKNIILNIKGGKFYANKV
jgi:hypothetical protein